MQGRGNILLRLSITLLGAFLLEKVCGEEDTQEHCSYWAAQGECAKNPGMCVFHFWGIHVSRVDSGTLEIQVNKTQSQVTWDTLYSYW